MDKKPRKHNKAWQDTTRNERQQRRYAHLNEIARLAGYPGWRAYETAVLNGLATINQKPS